MHQERIGLLTEGIQQFCYLADRGGMADGNGAVAVIGSVGMSLDGVQDFLDQIVDIYELKRGVGITNRDRQISRYVVAKGCDDGIVVGSAPLAEEIGQAIHHDIRTRFPAVFENELLCALLGLPVEAAGVASRQTRLNGRGQQHGTAPVVFAEYTKKPTRKVRVARFKFAFVLRSVHARKVDDKISPTAEPLKLLGGYLPCAEENVVCFYSRTGLISAVFYGINAFRKVPADKAVRTGD